jgi:CubicO group peptidase (beta-lactamase class C family)
VVQDLHRLDRHAASGQLSLDLATLPELMDTYRVPGISVAAGQQGEQTWAAGYGTLGTDVSTPVDPRTPFQACSISKHAAAFGALRLVADGVLDLDTDIHDYLTSWQLPTGQGWRATVTLRQLLAHTAGLSANWFRGYGVDEAIPSPLETLRGEAPANTPPVQRGEPVAGQPLSWRSAAQ